MSNYWNSNEDNVETRKAKSESYLKSQGYTKDRYGHWESSNNPTASSKRIDERTGNIITYDM